MTATREMLDNVTTWLRTHTFGVSGYIGVSGILGQVQPTSLKQLGDFVSTFANINVIIAFLVGAITLSIKVMEFYEKLRKKRAKAKEDEANRDSRGMD